MCRAVSVACAHQDRIGCTSTYSYLLVLQLEMLICKKFMLLSLSPGGVERTGFVWAHVCLYAWRRLVLWSFSMSWSKLGNKAEVKRFDLQVRSRVGFLEVAAVCLQIYRNSFLLNTGINKTQINYKWSQEKPSELTSNFSLGSPI